jgi:hypothetical protein
LNESFNNALRTSGVIFAFEEWYKDIRCQVCKMLSWTIYGRGQIWKSQRKSSSWDSFPDPDCVTSIGWVQLQINFSTQKKNSPRQPKMFYTPFDCYHMNQAQTQTLSVLPCPGRPIRQMIKEIRQQTCDSINIFMYQNATFRFLNNLVINALEEIFHLCMRYGNVRIHLKHMSTLYPHNK